MEWQTGKDRSINDGSNAINRGKWRRDAGGRGDGKGDGRQGADGRGGGHGRGRVGALGGKATYGSSKHAAGNPSSVGAESSSSKQPGTSHPRNPFGFMRLYKFLETPADDVLLAINKDKSEWRALLESPDITGDQLIIILEILSEKVGADVPVLQQLQMNALTSAVSCGPLIDKIKALIGSPGFLTLEITNERRNSRSTTPVNRNPMKILQNVHDLSAFVLKKMPSIALDNFFKIITLAVSQSLLCGDNELSGKFQDLFQKIGDLSKKEFAKKETAKQRVRKHHFNDADMNAFDAEEPPDTIQEIEVIPSIKELMNTETEEIYLRPNKPTGAYNDAKHYLDVQFRLLREDFVAPLRRGLKVFKKDKQDYISGRKRMPLGEIRLYRSVTIIGSQMKWDTIAYKLQLPLVLYGKIKWEKSKKLLPGSLILLTTPDNCLQSQNTHFGVVLNRDEKELKQGIVTVSWEGSPPSHDRNLEYLLFESEVYLEAYRHTLETLKVLDLENFPMKRYIVDASKVVEPPKYLRTDCQISISLSLADDQTSKILPRFLNRFSFSKPVREIKPLENDQWPTAEELGLDSHQFEAFRTALTKEFTIIQGPPGTGKTFLGLKIAKTLLTNDSLWRGPVGREDDADVAIANPMIVVCYTNHALDQFLEGILKFYQNELNITDPNIVRVGGRCESEELKKFTLREVKKRKGDSIKYRYNVTSEERRLRRNVEEFEGRKLQGMKEIIGLTNLQGVVDFENLTLNWDGSLFALYPSHLWKILADLKWFGLQGDCRLNAQEIVGKWFKVRAEPPLGSKPEVASQNLRDLITSIPTPKVTTTDGGDVENDEEEHDMDELMANRIAEEEVIFEVESQQIFQPDTMKGVPYLRKASIDGCSTALNEIYQLINRPIEPTQNLSTKVSAWTRERRIILEDQRWTLENRKLILEEIFRLYNQNLLDLPDVTGVLEKITVNGGADWEGYDHLKMDERWALYFTVVENLRKLFPTHLTKLERRRTTLHKELQEVTRLADGLILEGAKVVGLTTTGAGKYNSLLRMMKSKIVIVEEAAEVLEAHVVTCITQHCQQLILIGDHKQLRPNPTVYELAKKYNLDLSFFERMIKNDLHCYPLKTQHRMRPMIADLVKDTIYEELENHASVSLYPDVKGVAKNLFFISHSEKEESEKDSLSKSNVHEARFIVALCRHLVLQGYDPKQITILTMYMGQMFLLRKEVRQYQSCDGVRVTCVDNFQGEENDIILLSLVRSNDEGKIGFVGVDNRICVALSRAKHGLYVIGNLEVMFEQNATWEAIKKKLEVHDAIGTSLELVCVNHCDIKSKVSKAEHFKALAPQGGCTKMCDTTLNCGHKCPQVCHVKDSDHKEFRCFEPCPKLCDNLEHPCKGFCYEECPPCRVTVTRELPCPYKHTVKMFCFKDVAEEVCYELVEKTLPCEHTAIMACYMSLYECKVKVDKELPCGHFKRNVECHLDPMVISCNVITAKVLEPCQHIQNAECWRSPDEIKCFTTVPKIFPDCGHQTMIECHMKDSEFVACLNICEARLDCGHSCTRMCHVNEDPEHLTFMCRKNCIKECKEGHPCKMQHICYQKCPPCKVKFERELPCGHKKFLECGLDLESYQCKEKCERKLACDHECPNLCFEECGPCKTEVTEQVTSCGHDQKVICGETPVKENCEVLVPPKNAPLCGHSDTKIPCNMENASPEKVTKLCQQPCEFKFQDCDHTCGGNCSACLHGRVHLKCQAECGRSLVCCHRCNVSCSAKCPPCQAPCQMKCEHSKCTKKCGESCVKCREKCRWSCPHQKCTKRCGDLCDREPCDVPCTKTLKKCEHPCIGFCGEPCPPLCRICDREELTSFVLSGNESEDDARFVFLPDCGHTIEVEGLTRSLTFVADDGQIKAKVCPKCSSPIRNCRRFGNLIRGHWDKVEKIRKKSQGNPENAKKIQKQLVPQLITSKSQEVKNLFPEVWTSFRGYLMEKVKRGKGTVEVAKKKLPDEFVMVSLEYIANAVLQVAKMLDRDFKEGKLCDPWYDQIKDMYLETFKSMLERQPLIQQEVLDFNGELTRLDYFRQLMLRRSTATCNPSNVEAFSWFLKAEQKVASETPMTLADKLDFKVYLENLDETLKTGLGITEEERREIVTGSGMNQGDWFKCPNGHIYVIKECGGATERGVCNECKAEIGGGNNLVVSGNQLASEMDGATAPCLVNNLEPLNNFHVE